MVWFDYLSPGSEASRVRKVSDQYTRKEFIRNEFYVEHIIMCSFIILQWVITVLVTFARKEEKNWNGWIPYLVGKV